MSGRTLTVAVAAEIIKPVTQPGWFLEARFAGGTSRICSFGTTVWNGLTWTGANFKCEGFDGNYKRATVVIWDPTYVFRTLALGTAGGIRNRVIKVWQAQYAALADADPSLIFSGVGDAVGWARGHTTITCARLNSDVLMAPRMRVSSATGFNHIAPAGTVIQWGNTQITLQPAR